MTRKREGRGWGGYLSPWSCDFGELAPRIQSGAGPLLNQPQPEPRTSTHTEKRNRKLTKCGHLEVNSLTAMVAYLQPLFFRASC